MYRDSLSPKAFFYFNKIQLSGLHAHKYPYRKMIPNTICWRIVMSRKKRKKSLSKNCVMIGQLISISFCVSKSSLFDSVVCSLTSTTFVSFVFLFQKHCIFRIPANCPAHPVYILTRKVGIGSSSEAWWQERTIFDRTTTAPPDTTVIFRYIPMQNINSILIQNILVNLSVGPTKVKNTVIHHIFNTHRLTPDMCRYQHVDLSQRQLYNLGGRIIDTH